LKPLCCPEDCEPPKYRDFNIYWFGADLTDAGNARLNLGLKSFVVSEIDRGFCGVAKFGCGPCARASNGKVYSEFVAEDFDFNVDLEYDIQALPEEKNYLVSFSLKGATQCGNNNPIVEDSSNDYGVVFQVDRYLELYDKSTCYSFPEKDLFMYTDVGLNDLLNLIYFNFNLTPDFTNYIQKVRDNVIKLYSEGKARRMIVLLDSRYYLEQTPLFDQLSCIYDAELGDILDAFDLAQMQLANELTAFAQSQPHFDLTVLSTESLFMELVENSETYGIVNDGETMIDLGWPDKNFENQLWFDDIHPTSHTHRVVANFVKTWFQQKICY
jgi:hypothetical protein